MNTREVFEKFTDGARRTVVLAQEESRLLSHDYIGTEHILLGLVVQDDGPASYVLRGASVTPDRARAAVLARTGQGPNSPSGHIPFTPQAKKVLELSLRQALRLDHAYIGTEHLLLGLLGDTDGLAVAVLRDLGCDPDQLRAEVEAVAGTDPPSEPLLLTPPDAPRVGIVRAVAGDSAGGRGAACSFCGRDLWEVERHVASGQARICADCVEAAGAAIEHARAEGTPITEPLRLAPRVYGPPPPDDGAVAGVIEAFASVFGPSADDASRARSLEDGEAIGGLIHQASTRYPQSGGAVVEALRFASPDVADVRFSILLRPDLGFPFEGQALHHDGRWLVSRETFCRLLGMAGVPCPPPDAPA